MIEAKEGIGTVTVGVEYLVDIERENAIMQQQISMFRRYFLNEVRGSSYVSSSDKLYAEIFNIPLPQEKGDVE